jgi:hypothetical protein
METLIEAKRTLEEAGFHVSSNSALSLWIAPNVIEIEAGIKLSSAACSIGHDGTRWIAVFPSEGLSTYEVPGELEDLVSLILAVFKRYHEFGEPIGAALKAEITDVDQYLIGRSLTGV